MEDVQDCLLVEQLGYQSLDSIRRQSAGGFLSAVFRFRLERTQFTMEPTEQIKQALAHQGLRNVQGHLMIEDLKASDLASACGTPLYVYSQSRLEQTMQTYVDVFKSDEFDTRVLYSSKAFSCLEIYRLADQFGLGVDVVSLQEMQLALAAGIDPAMIVFHGNNKSPYELSCAFEKGIGCIVADGIEECERLAAMAPSYPEKNRPQILLRLNPGIEAHTHAYIQTACADSKFGISMQEQEAIMRCITLLQSAGLSVGGFHAHIGSQIFEISSFEKEVELLGAFLSDFQKETGFQADVLDLGGGFAAWYTSADTPTAIEDTCKAILASCKQIKEQYHLPLRSIWIEPGRSIVCNAAVSLYHVGDQKDTPHKHYVFVDGGMSDNIRPAIYQADYTAALVDRLDEPYAIKTCIAGCCCESGDVLIESITLPKAQRNDVLALFATGAYGWSMASSYNRHLLPGVVFVKGDQARWVIRPQTIEDMLALETDTPISLNNPKNNPDPSTGQNNQNNKEEN